VHTLDLAELARIAVADCDPADDIHGDVTYRRQVGAVTVEQALQQAVQEAGRD
jgi:CO/xanthine dehydrogenase FAD-binding subunit